MKSRIIGLAVMLFAIGFWALLLSMSPSAKGYGTHVQLGLSSCGYLTRYHYPCPGCGVTTSLSAVARGRVIDALDANIFGVAIFICIIGSGCIGAYQLATGKNIFVRIGFRWWYVAIILGLMLVSWIIKIAVGVARGDYPIA